MSKLKKVLKKINYIQLSLDLIIVFIGVTLAFVFTNYKEQQKEEKETQRVIGLLKVGIERYEGLFKGFIQRHDVYNEEFRERLNNGFVQNYQGITYPSPQYPTHVISQLLSNQRNLNTDAYVLLISFSNGIKRLIYTEEKLVENSEKYIQLPENTGAVSPIYYIEQEKWARQYLRYLDIRKNILQELVAIISQLKTLI
ncbi:hypothetical protein D7030_09825 [Flavobacteriaceae bacterium AU392]|nr:hypothetical protein D1817_06985 [Flavobacteriaceae bacterium]RKM83585.1 hypothetical protein D7030_09825 [Flavobacteriaceae bacterium AU392]